MNFNYKNIKYTIARYTGMVAISTSVLLFACGGESNHYAGGSDANEGTGAAGGNNPGTADTLTVGGASDGTPPGYGAMQDTVHTPGVNLDSIRQSQTGSNTVNSGTGSGEVNTSANPNGQNSALSDSVNAGTKSHSGGQTQSNTGANTNKKNIQPNNKNNKEGAENNSKSNIK